MYTVLSLHVMSGCVSCYQVGNVYLHWRENFCEPFLFLLWQPPSSKDLWVKCSAINPLQLIMWLKEWGVSGCGSLTYRHHRVYVCPSLGICDLSEIPNFPHQVHLSPWWWFVVSCWTVPLSWRSWVFCWWDQRAICNMQFEKMERGIGRRTGGSVAVRWLMYRSTVLNEELSWNVKLSIYRPLYNWPLYIPAVIYGHWVMTKGTRFQLKLLSSRVTGHTLWDERGAYNRATAPSHQEEPEEGWCIRFWMPTRHFPWKIFEACQGRPWTSWRVMTFGWPGTTVGLHMME